MGDHLAEQGEEVSPPTRDLPQAAFQIGRFEARDAPLAGEIRRGQTAQARQTAQNDSHPNR